MKIRFIGHNSFLFTFDDGLTLLTDPWFYKGKILRTVPPALSAEDIQQCDILLSSHNHLDHIDKPSLKMAKRLDSRVVGSLRVQARAKKAGFSDAVGLKPGEFFERDQIRITATPAEHPFAPEAVGFVISAGQKNIYFSGDTRYFDGLVSFLKSCKLHAMFVQIACMKYFGKEDGMNIKTAAALVSEVKPDFAVPMHYHGRFKEADPYMFAEVLKSSSVKVLVFQSGEEKVL